MLKARQKLDKYRIERKLAQGGFATVYRAFDTIEGIRVAVKVPDPHVMDKATLNDFRHEVRLAAKLDHANILPLKTAGYVDGQFVMVMALGDRTLEDRLRRRLSVPAALGLFEQMLGAVAYAHEQRIIHCDLKPDNFILFGDDKVRLSDFGIAKVALRTLRASGSGTLHYMAPEQALGKPSFRSDVFSLGLVFYRMLAGVLPEWPFDWPPPGFTRLRDRVHPDLIEMIRRAMEVDAKKRYRDAVQMYAVFSRVKARALRFAKNETPTAKVKGKTTRRDWRTIRRREFQRRFGKLLETKHECGHCQGPVSEAMRACPWCGKLRKKHRGDTSFPAQCVRCHRGMKLDWRYCPWCYGPGFEPHSDRAYPDKRYEGRCENPQCDRKVLMPFMRYCPWCRRKVKKKWPVAECKDRCPSCRWGVVAEFWSFCPWCEKSLESRR
ncbi:MAG: protein kinase [Planctomycetales bacterium]|nr:protein kinase [Planctomycetales bacterium]